MELQNRITDEISVEDYNSDAFSCGFYDLSEDVVEYIFLHLSPYGDLQNCRLVSKQWKRLAEGAMGQMNKLLLRCLSFDWFMLQAPESNVRTIKNFCTVTERCSHSACFDPTNGCIFVFGGCTAAYTTFNDLWKFDLSQRVWSRPMPSGYYPTPKACSTMVEYKGQLLLYGGWSKSSPNPIHQTAMFYNELHAYDLRANCWTLLGADNQAPHLAGHSCSVVEKCMVVFGGSNGSGSSNRIWIYNIEHGRWFSPETNLPKPAPRYGQSQILIDDKHILIIGGCGGPNLIISDVWLLTMNWTSNEWLWEEITVLNPHLSAPQLWSHPACKVGSKVLVLSKSPRVNKRRGSYRSMSISSPRLSTGCPTTTRNRSNWLPPQGNLIPPRQRKLISSRSLDEKNPPSSARENASSSSSSDFEGGVGGSGGQQQTRNVNAHHSAELQRARSIPAIIVGEIPRLVVTEVGVAAAQQNASQPPALQEPQPGEHTMMTTPQRASQCVAMAASSLLPNVATAVEPPPPSPNVEIGGEMPTSPPQRSSFTQFNNVPAHYSVLPSTSQQQPRAPQTARSAEKKMEAWRRMDEFLRNRALQQQTYNRSVAITSSSLNFDFDSSVSSTISTSINSVDCAASGLKFRPSSPPPKTKRQSLDNSYCFNNQIGDSSASINNISTTSVDSLTAAAPSSNCSSLTSSASSSPTHSDQGVAPAVDECTTGQDRNDNLSETNIGEKSPMAIYILDTSYVLNAKTVSWSVLDDNWGAPDDTILYSMVKGRGELILFGGMRSQTSHDSHGLDVTPFSHTITNETYILRPPISF